MYNLDQLKSKEIGEVQQIATELGIANVDQMDHASLMLRILDEQADKMASMTSNEEKSPKRRQRMTVKNVDRVYSATQTKAKKIDKKMQKEVNDSLFATLTEEEKRMLQPTPAETETSQTNEATATSTQPEAVAPAETTTLQETETVAKPKRTRKKAATAEQTEAETKEETDTEKTEEKPKRTRKKAEEKLTEENQAPVVATAIDTDFIIIQDIPEEKDFIVSPAEMYAHTTRAEVETAPVNKSQAKKEKEQEQTQARTQQKKKTVTYEFDNIIKVTGVLEIIENYGFLRSSDYNYLPSPDDVYVSLQQIKQWSLKMGDVVECTVRPPREGERFFPLVNVIRINGCDPSVVRDRVSFDFLTPLFPDEKFKLCKGFEDSKSSRIVDMFAPIGKGQRALIVAQPKTGKTMLMKDIANSIAANHPEAYLMMLLIDERPEEVTDMARTVNAEVIASTFDAPAENHVKIAGIVLEKAKRMVECGHDVVIFLDSITRLARAYNTVSPASGKVLSGGVEASALHKPKRFFGAARNIEGGGSLTIIATALIDTGSKMDEVIFEEFKGTGNMELQLDRQLANKRVFPAVNLIASSTRRDDLLLDQTMLNRMWVLRKHIAEMTPLEAMDTLMPYIERTKTNEEFISEMNG